MSFLKPFKKASLSNVTQNFNATHRAIDWLPFRKEGLGAYGTPLVAPEKVKIGNIYTPQYMKDNPHDDAPIKNGYGLWMKGVSGKEHLYWHTQPVFPVAIGEVVEKGTIIAYCGNSGNVFDSGTYVPLEDRNKPNFAGTHLHQAIVQDGIPEDPLTLLDLVTEPDYGILDELKAISIVLLKISKLLS